MAPKKKSVAANPIPAVVEPAVVGVPNGSPPPAAPELVYQNEALTPQPSPESLALQPQASPEVSPEQQAMMDGTGGEPTKPRASRASEVFGNAMKERSKIQFRRRPIWTGLLLIAWLCTGAVVFLTHIAVSKIIPPIANLPTNVLNGFNDAFRFKNLYTDGMIVKNNSRWGMGTCFNSSIDTFYDGCETVPTFAPLEKLTTTTTYLDAIHDAFTRSLTLILNVTTDRCLAADGFNSTAKNLQDVLKATAQIDATDAPCLATWNLYCGIYKAGDAIMIGSSTVTTQIDSMANSDAVKKFTEHSSKLKIMHGLPYILVFSMIFFTAFWWYSGGVCCCCNGGNCIGCCCCLIPHVLLWFVYCVLAAIIVGVGWFIPKWAEDNKVGFSGATCTVADLMDHIETTYAGFYNLVFKDLIEGCLMFVRAFRAALAMCIFSGAYALCICICRPYNRTKKGQQRLTDTE